MPDGVAVQKFPLGAVTAAGDGNRDPAFQPGHLLIAWRQGSDGDQHAAQVLNRLSGGQFVEGFMGQRPRPGLEITQDLRGGAPVQPGRHRAGALDRKKSLAKASQFRGDLAVLVAEQVTQPPVQGAAGAPADVAAARPCAGLAQRLAGGGAGRRAGEQLWCLRGGHRSRAGPGDAGSLGAQAADPDSPPLTLALRAGVAAATGSTRSSIVQPRMSSSAIRTFRLSRSGRSATSR